MVNSTFPLDFIITVNSKKEILLFHKDMQQTLSQTSEGWAAEKHLWFILTTSMEVSRHSILANCPNYVPEFLAQYFTGWLCDGGRNQSKRYAGIPQWNYSLTETNLCRGCISLPYYITSKCFDHLLINSVSFFGVLSFVVT